MFHVYQFTSWPLPWFHIDFLHDVRGVFFAQLSDGSFEVKALKIEGKETFLKDSRLTFKDTWHERFVRSPAVRLSTATLWQLHPPIKKGETTRSCRRRSGRFHKVIVDDSDNCFPAFIHSVLSRSHHTVDHLLLTSRTNQFEAVEKLKRKFLANIFSKHPKFRMQARQSRKAPAAVTQNDNSLRHVNKWVTHLPCSRICLNSLNGANHSEPKQLWPFAKRIPAICFQASRKHFQGSAREGKQRTSGSLSCVFLKQKAEK